MLRKDYIGQDSRKENGNYYLGFRVLGKLTHGAGFHLGEKSSLGHAGCLIMRGLSEVQNELGLHRAFSETPTYEL